MVPLYYRGSQAGLICFDLTNESTFGESIDYWTNELNEALESGTFKLFLVGNKSDLIEERKITREMAESVASKMGMTYFETSSKTGQGVSEMF
jgi:GTPase SAR1 family protein